MFISLVFSVPILLNCMIMVVSDNVINHTATESLYSSHISLLESIIVPVHEKGGKTDCSNYHGMSLLPTSYKILSSILPSRLSPYVDEIIGVHQYGFQRNRSIRDQICCFHQILEKKWEYNETVYHLFIDFKKACDSVRGEVLYDILIELEVPMKLVMRLKCV
jgi:hypothetical protein